VGARAPGLRKRTRQQLKRFLRHVTEMTVADAAGHRGARHDIPGNPPCGVRDRLRRCAARTGRRSPARRRPRHRCAQFRPSSAREVLALPAALAGVTLTDARVGRACLTTRGVRSAYGAETFGAPRRAARTSMPKWVPSDVPDARINGTEQACRPRSPDLRLVLSKRPVLGSRRVRFGIGEANAPRLSAPCTRQEHSRPLAPSAAMRDKR
jgi:hypothetical protein